MLPFDRQGDGAQSSHLNYLGPHRQPVAEPGSDLRSCLEMLLLLLLVLLLLLLLPLAVLWQQQAQGPGPSWLASLQHRVACGALCWAAAWQQWRLEQSTLHAGQRQQQALRWCLKGTQGPHSPLRGSTGVFSRVWGGGPKRKEPHRTIRFQNLKTFRPPRAPNTERLSQRPSPGSALSERTFPTLDPDSPAPIQAWPKSLLQRSHQPCLKLLGNCVASRGVYDVFGATDMTTFRNHLPLTKASQAQEEESGEQLLPPTSKQQHGEASLQATLLGLAALNQAYPAALAPGSTACVTPASPWPHPLPWPWHTLSQGSPPGAKDPGALLLEALRSPGLRALEARTAVELLDIFSGLEADGEELAEAIAAGNPGAPLPTRAAELREALEQGPRGLALRLWPKLQVVVTLDAGGQGEAVAALEALWCQGLAFFSPAYAASGGAVGLNLWPEQPAGLYLLPPGAPLIELLPVQEGGQGEAATTILLAEAQKGQEYELVLTDQASLTRCRLGDVVRVVGAYNQCPVVRFICRLGQSLSVRGEDIGEDMFSEALGRAVGQWPGAKLLDHVCVESSILDSSGGSAPHYEVFVALRGLRNLSEENRDKLDRCLQEASPCYKALRFRGSVGPARVHLVGPGAFRALREALAASPAAPFPPAMPRVLRHRHLAQLLQRRVVS